MQFLIGVDGGGTKTEACVARISSDHPPEVLGWGLAGSSNMLAAGTTAALDNLSTALNAAWQDAGLQAVPADCAVLALAGARQPEVQQQVQAWATQFSLAKRIRFAHDGEIALKAGTPDGWGIALIAGTGSVAFGMNRQGQIETAGGWGYWFGDEGSGFWLGQSALRAVSLASDGRGPDTLLCEIVLTRLNITEPRKMLAALAERGDLRIQIGSLANAVTQAAAQNDPVAQEIMRSAVHHFTSSITTVAEKLSLGAAFPLAIAGGVLCNSEMIREQLLRSLDGLGLKPSRVEVVTKPVLGCLNIGLEESRRK